MDAFIKNIKEEERSSLRGKKLSELPIGTVVSIEGSTYLRADNTILMIGVEGHLLTISDTLRDYVQRKVPTVIYGNFRFYPLG